MELGIINPESLGILAFKDDIVINTEKDLPAIAPVQSETLTFNKEFISAISSITFIPE